MMMMMAALKCSMFAALLPDLYILKPSKKSGLLYETVTLNEGQVHSNVTKLLNSPLA